MRQNKILPPFRKVVNRMHWSVTSRNAIRNETNAGKLRKNENKIIIIIETVCYHHCKTLLYTLTTKNRSECCVFFLILAAWFYFLRTRFSQKYTHITDLMERATRNANILPNKIETVFTNNQDTYYLVFTQKQMIYCTDLLHSVYSNCACLKY